MVSPYSVVIVAGAAAGATGASRPGVRKSVLLRTRREQRAVHRRDGGGDRAFVGAVLVELLHLAVARHGGVGQVGQDHVVEQGGHRALPGVEAAADIERAVVDVVLEVVGVAVVFRRGRAVQAVALDRQLLQRRVGLQRVLDREVAGVGQRRRPEAQPAHDGDDGVHLALEVGAVDGLLALAQQREAGVLEHRLGVGLPALDHRQGTARERGSVRVVPFQGQIGRRLVFPLRVGGPDVAVRGDRGRDHVAGQRQHLVRAGRRRGRAPPRSPPPGRRRPPARRSLRFC